MHCKAYPTIQNLSGIDGDSRRLRTKTAAATTTNAKFQIMSRTTTGFEYAQSLCRSSNCSAAVSLTNIDGSRIIRRLLARRRNRAASRRLCLRTDRRLRSSSRPSAAFPSSGVDASMMSSDARSVDPVVDIPTRQTNQIRIRRNPNSPGRLGSIHGD